MLSLATATATDSVLVKLYIPYFKYSNIMAARTDREVAVLPRGKAWLLPPVVMDQRIQEHVTSIFDQVGDPKLAVYETILNAFSELFGALVQKKAGEVVENMLRLLATPPPLTTLRFNRLKCSQEEAVHSLRSYVSKVQMIF